MDNESLQEPLAIISHETGDDEPVWLLWYNWCNEIWSIISRFFDSNIVWLINVLMLLISAAYNVYFATTLDFNSNCNALATGLYCVAVLQVIICIKAINDIDLVKDDRRLFPIYKLLYNYWMNLLSLFGICNVVVCLKGGCQGNKCNVYVAVWNWVFAVYHSCQYISVCVRCYPKTFYGYDKFVKIFLGGIVYISIVVVTCISI